MEEWEYCHIIQQLQPDGTSAKEVRVVFDDTGDWHLESSLAEAKEQRSKDGWQDDGQEPGVDVTWPGSPPADKTRSTKIITYKFKRNRA